LELGLLPAVYRDAFRPAVALLYLERGAPRCPRSSAARSTLLKRLNGIGAAQIRPNRSGSRVCAPMSLPTGMQTAAPEAVDLAKETDATKELLAWNDATSASYGRRCCCARRLVERGVRFIQVVSGAPDGETEITSWERTAIWRRPRRWGTMVDSPSAACWPI